MSEPTIICPSCKTEIKLTESLAAPLIESTRREYEKRVAQKDADRKELENYTHPDVIKHEYSAYAGTGQAFEDVPILLAQAVREASESDQSWVAVAADPEKLTKKVSKVKSRLCNEFASKMTKDLLTKIDTSNEVRIWLSAISEALKAQ